jgi:glycosyltransferase involved in cell wall biosynthesis
MAEICFFLSHQPNPRFVKQINYFAESEGTNVTLLHFTRENLANLNNELHENVTVFSLPVISDGDYFSRIIIYLKAIRLVKDFIKKTSPQYMILNNIDMLILYKAVSMFIFGVRKPEIIMEISDLREFVFKTSLSARLLGNIEKHLYQRLVTKIITTSARFFEYHHSRFFNGPWFLLENKPLKKNLPAFQQDTAASNVVTVGIIGLLLRGEEYKTLFQVIRDLPGYRVEVWGKGKDQTVVENCALSNDNVVYYGPYNFFIDAARIYNSVDIIYCVYKTSEAPSNNSLALPNKLYEAMYFKTPIIASEGTYLGEIVKEKNIGYCVKSLDENSLLACLTDFKKNKNRFKQSFDKLSESAFLADEDYSELKKFIFS